MNQQNKNDLLALRHSAEHILTQAMHELYGKDQVVMAMGPATDTGFYFDFDSTDDFKLTEEMFPEIEAKMKEIVKRALPITRETITQEAARKLFVDNPYKIEWLDEIKDKGEEISIYHTGDQFVDLCAGPHVDNTSEVKVIKLLSIAGAYWHGDEKNKMLTRLYGTAFKTPKELKQYLWQQQEAKKRDHRKLGKELDLFTFSPLVGSGLPLYTARGTHLRRTLNEFVESVQSDQEYTQVWTPQIARAELFKKSGHYDKYKDDMFTVHSHYSDDEMFLKPMNCPQHAEIYNSRPRSYRDLPIRLTDFAMLYRDEKPGELNGLARVRAFSQDDCHVFCRMDQVDAEVDLMIQMTKKIMNTFGFKYRYRLSTRDPEHPEKYLGDPKEWDRVEEWAVKIMERNEIEYYDGPGEAAFYAPKMDLMATDALGREWQLSTVQIDMVQPRRFDMTYTNNEGKDERPVTIHRAIIGSPERLMMILIEHYAGAFPLWLAPVQLQLVTISDTEVEHAQSLLTSLKKAGLRVELDDSNKSLGKKLALARGNKSPYTGIVGAKEVETNTITLKNREGDQTTLNLDETIAKLRQEIDSKV